MTLDNYRFFATPHSANAKTGDIAQTYTNPETCPTRCPFKGHGCYAENFGANFQWKRAENGFDVWALIDWVQANTEEGDLIRHNVAGDICYPNSNDIDPQLVNYLIIAYRGRKAYTYTHAEVNERNAQIVRDATSQGFVISFSCETPEEVDKAFMLGCMAVLTVTKAVEPNATTPNGWRIIQCPNQTHNDVTCKSCALCARLRGVVIAFQTHGTRAKKANEAIEQKITIHR